MYPFNLHSFVTHRPPKVFLSLLSKVISHSSLILTFLLSPSWFIHCFLCIQFLTSFFHNLHKYKNKIAIWNPCSYFMIPFKYLFYLCSFTNSLQSKMISPWLNSWNLVNSSSKTIHAMILQLRESVKSYNMLW